MNSFGNLKHTPIRPLIELITVKKSIDANIELARRIVRNNPDAVNYFLGHLTRPIVKYISERIMFEDISGEFFDFISDPYDEIKKEFGWKPVSNYSAENGSSLKNYTSVISCRYFYKRREEEKKRNNASMELVEYYDYESLLFLSDTTNPEEEETPSGEMKRRLRRAYSRLSEKEQLAIQLLVIHPVSGLEAFEELKKYLSPKVIASGEAERWSKKEIQNRVSVLKGRALERLLKFYNETN